MWWWCSIQLRRVLVGCTLLAASSLAVSVARAQDRDEAWVISQIVAGKFDELRSLEALSAQGVPFAMYWWGAMLEHCIFERCDKGGARELILRASDAKLRADLLAMAKSELQIGMRAIVAQLQGPTSTDLDVLAETGNDVFSEPLMQRF
jgi:hypothetical protein